MGMMERCMEAMGSMGGMMDGGVMTGVFAILAVLLVVFLVGLATVGTLGFWAVRKFASR